MGALASIITVLLLMEVAIALNLGRGIPPTVFETVHTKHALLVYRILRDMLRG